MFERDVTISLNADVSNYSSSLSQAIAITQQYSSAADTALGSAAKLNASFVQGLIKVSSGLTGPQRMATDAAAAYQQQMSGLQATAAVTGQNFGQLEKTTRSLARSFPIGMGQAVQQVQALQSAGVTSNKEIERLAVSFTKLGAANNAFGPELGQQMLQVTRAFGNSTTQVEALGDSLTTVSKTMGASATGVLTFSKAIAPIASTVGMSQTAVMGLSAAMSRLGEDGYMAANSFQKVLLDMNRNLRDGGPELKVYADLLNMTADSLKKLFDNDPTEVLLRFTEAVSRAGPEAQRTLEALGLDGVRTTRSITALSRSGNLRESVNVAVGAYGDGSTNRAAEEAFSGVNDQMTRLSESMRQTVASAGKPFLGFMEMVLKLGTGVSEVTNKVMENDGVQKLATAGIVGGFGASLLFKGLAATSLGAMVVNLLRGGRDSAPGQAFRDARQMGRMGYTAGNMAAGGGPSGLAGRLGAFVGNIQGPTPDPDTRPGFRERVATRLDRWSSTAMGAGTRFMGSDMGNMERARGAVPADRVTPTGAALRAATGDLVRAPSMANLAATGAAARGYVGGLTATPLQFARTGAAYVAEGARTAGRGLGAVAGGIGRGLGQLGVTPALAAVAGIGVTSYLMYQNAAETSERRDQVRAGATGDIFSAFNQFAEAAGMAGRGLVDFAASVRESTNALATQNQTFEQAGKLTDAETAQAMSPGYDPAFKIIGDAIKSPSSSVDQITAQALATLGPMASPMDVARVVSDIAAQTSPSVANQVGENIVAAMQEGAAKVDFESAFQDALDNTATGPYAALQGTSAETAQIIENYGKSVSMQGYRVSQVYDEEAGQIARIAGTRGMYESLRPTAGEIAGARGFGTNPAEFFTEIFRFWSGNGDSLVRKNEAASMAAESIFGQLGLSEEQITGIFGNRESRVAAIGDMDWDAMVAAIRRYERDTGDRPAVLDVIDDATARGIDLSDPSWESFNGVTTEVEKSARTMEQTYNRISERGFDLTDVLYGMTSAAREAGVTLDELASRPGMRARLTDEQDLVLEATMNTSAASTNAAADALVRRALEKSGGDVAQARAALNLTAQTAREGTKAKDIATAAAGAQFDIATLSRIAAMPDTRVILQQFRQGIRAREMGYQPGNDQLEAGRQKDIAAGEQASASMVDMTRNFMLQRQALELQLKQSREQAGLQMSQMARDYNISVSRANQDFRTQEQRATRDFNIQMNRQEKDYQRDRRFAVQDFNRQERYNEQDYKRQRRYAQQDYNTSMVRMERDYTKQVKRTREEAQIAEDRANRDFKKTYARVERDFAKQMLRMESDFNLQRSRATEDYNKSITRANEDYARQRARAERDFARQQANAEADFNRNQSRATQDNLKQRTRSIEDFNKQMRRLVEDSAKNLYDPYKRIEAQMVMDGGQLVANLASQNKALRDQLDTLDQLRASGLSQQSIDVLGLADAKNAQQAARLLADSMTDPALIASLNEQISGRVDLTQMFATSEDNVQTRRMTEDFAQQMSRNQEDFAQSMARMDEDFATATARARENFTIAMSDMGEDFATQMARAGEDFATAMARMDEDYLTAVTRAKEDQAQALADMTEDHAQALADSRENLARTLQLMGEDYESAVRDAGEDFLRAMLRMQEEYNISVARSREQFEREMERQDEAFARMRRRAQRDFDRQMADAAADFQKMLGRMAEDYANALADMGASLALAQKHAMESLIGYGQIVAEGDKAIFKDFATFVANLPADQQKNMGEAMRSMLEYMRDRFPGMFKQYFPNGIAGIVLNNQPGTPGGTPPYGSGPGGAPEPGTEGGPGANKGADPWVESGKAAAEGWVNGFLNFINPWTYVETWITNLIEAVKGPRGFDEGSPSKKFIEIGKNVIVGFFKGFTDFAPSPREVLEAFTKMFAQGRKFLEDLPGSMSRWIGENKVLQEIGKSLPGAQQLEMLIEGRFDDFGKWLKDLPAAVLTWIGENSIFVKIAKALPLSRDLEKEIEDRFTGFKDWASKLPQNILAWIGETEIFKNIKKALPGVSDVRDAIADIFGDDGKGAKKWFRDLPLNLGKWIKEGTISIVDGIMSGFPTIDKIKTAIDKWFKGDNGPKSWFGNLATLLSGWMPGASQFGDVFGKTIGEGFENFVNILIDKWNNFRLTVSQFSIPGTPITVGPFYLDTPNISRVNWFAEGGIVSGAQVIGVGEAGPEAVIPLNQRGAKVMADTLRQFIDDRAFSGALANPYVINVEMADVNLDFTDSGSEFSQQARELLQRVKDAAQSTELFMQATGLKITEIVDDASDSLVKLAQAIEDAFGQAAEDVEEDTKSIKDAVVSMNDAIETDFLSLSDALDTDLTDLTSSFSTAVDTIITETDRLISEAIARLEDFASGLPTAPDPGTDDPGTDDPGTDDPGTDDPPASDPPGGNTGRWSWYDYGYNLLNAADKSYVDKLVGGPLNESSFNNLSESKQTTLSGTVYGAGVMSMLSGGGLTAADKQTLEAAFAGGSPTPPPGGGAPPARDLSFKNYDTLSKAVSQSDQDFLKAQFGGVAPTSQTWNKVNETQRDALIKALEDKNITSDERASIKKLGLPSLGGGPETGDGDGEAETSWNVFRTGYRQLGDSDKKLVNEVFGGKEPTLDLWKQLTVTQQRRLRDVVRDGSIDKDEKDTVKDIDPYKIVGKQIVEYAKTFKDVPYKIPASPPDSFDCSTFTEYVYRKFGKDLDPYTDTQWLSNGGRDVTGKEMPGDLVFFRTGRVDNGYKLKTGHVGIYVGDGMMIDAPQPGDVVSINSATSRSNYAGARRYFAEGGIVNRRQDAVIGEAGPEVVVPLNERGAEFFASAMARYTQPADARQAMVSPYSTPVSISINQTYDNRTMFTGPIEVSANNPDEFAAKAAAKQRRQRLSQPLGSGR